MRQDNDRKNSENIFSKEALSSAVQTLKYFFLPPVFPDDETKTRSARALYVLLLNIFLILILSALGVIFIFAQKATISIILFFLFVCVLISFMLTKKGYIKTASWLFVSTLWLVGVLLLILNGRTNNVIVALHIPIIMMAGILLGRRSAIALTILSGTVGLVLALLKTASYPLYHYFDGSPISIWFTWMLSLAMTVIPLSVILNDYIQSLTRARMSEKRYMTLFKEAPVMYLIVREQDGVPVISDCNTAFAKTLKCQREQVIGQPLTYFYSPESQAALLNDSSVEYTAGFGQKTSVERDLVTSDGQIIHTLVNATSEFDEAGNPIGTLIMYFDITERKHAEDALQESEARIRSISNNLTAGMIYQLVIDPNGTRKFTYLSNSVQALYGISPQEGMDNSALIYDRLYEEDKLRLIKAEEEAIRTVTTFNVEVRIEEPSGKTRWSSLISTPRILADGSFCFDGLEFVITERKMAEENLRKVEQHFSRLVDSAEDIIFTLDKYQRHTGVYGKWLANRGMTPEQFLGKTARDLFGESAAAHEEANLRALAGEYVLYDWSVIENETIKFYQTSLSPLRDSEGEIVGIVGFGRDVTEKKYQEEQVRAHQLVLQHLLEESDESRRALLSVLEDQKMAEDVIRRRVAELEAVNRISAALRTAQTSDEMLTTLLDETLEALESETGDIMLYQPDKGVLRVVAARGWIEIMKGSSIQPGEGISGKVFEEGAPFITNDILNEPLVNQSIVENVPQNWGGVFIPIQAIDTVGVLFVAVPASREITAGQLRLLTALAEMAGVALHRMFLHEETKRRLDQLQALQTIDRAIAASLNSQNTLNILLEQVTSQLHVDAAGVLLLNPHTYTLKYAAGRGFWTRSYEQTYLQMGKGIAGRAAFERKPIQRIIHPESNDPLEFELLNMERFVTHIAVPFIAKGEIKGVLEVFHRKQIQPNKEWMGFLETLAGQAAIAIDNLQLFENLQRTNFDLTIAYDATIEGWSRAMDLRDRETEGHTQRVTSLTLKLAQQLGIREADLIHVRRGALLHDIGKLGVPDHILFKPGKLTDEEWMVMQQHPVFAKEMLTPIDYLKPALDIPLYHHEKWNGSGYPNRLRGEQIPFPARVFSIVDVWDALRSDRPYRSSWSEEQTRQYLIEQSGRHFDPLVTEGFLRLLDTLQNMA